MSNKVCNCIECGKSFTLTKEQREFFKSHDLVEPKRCETCRKLKIQVKTLKCKDCGCDMQFSALQEYQLKKKYGNMYSEPKLCKACKEKRSSRKFNTQR